MSKNKFFYDTVADAQRRVSQSVVLFRDDPVWVLDVVGLNRDQQAQILRLPFTERGQQEEVSFTPKDFTIRNLPGLGYCDYGRFSHYLSRIPSRQGKQGYCRTNVSVQFNPDGPVPNLDNLLSFKDSIDMLKNRYKRFDQVFDEIIHSEEPLKRAFSKKMALEIDDMESVTVEHRGIRVAIANNPKRHGPVFRLLDKYHFLREEFEENGIRIER